MLAAGTAPNLYSLVTIVFMGVGTTVALWTLISRRLDKAEKDRIEEQRKTRKKAVKKQRRVIVKVIKTETPPIVANALEGHMAAEQTLSTNTNERLIDLGAQIAEQSKLVAEHFADDAKFQRTVWMRVTRSGLKVLGDQEAEDEEPVDTGGPGDRVR